MSITIVRLRIRPEAQTDPWSGHIKWWYCNGTWIHELGFKEARPLLGKDEESQNFLTGTWPRFHWVANLLLVRQLQRDLFEVSNTLASGWVLNASEGCPHLFSDSRIFLLSLLKFVVLFVIGNPLRKQDGRGFSGGSLCHPKGSA